MATISLEKSLLNEMSHIMGNEDLMTQTIKFVRSIRRKAKAEKAEWEYVPNAGTRAAIEECESGKELETLDIANFKAVAKNSKHLILLILKPTSKVSELDGTEY